MKNRRTSNKVGKPKPERAAEDRPPIDRKALQEAQQPPNDDFYARRQHLLDETQGYMYQQSSKFSSVSRTLVVGIIGTIWVVTYADGRLAIPNWGLLASLIMGLIFLAVDVVHYYCDSKGYYDELNKLEGYQSQADLDLKHEKRMDCIFKRSRKFIEGKFWILVVTAAFFAVGFVQKLVV